MGVKRGMQCKINFKNVQKCSERMSDWRLIHIHSSLANHTLYLLTLDAVPSSWVIIWYSLLIIEHLVPVTLASSSRLLVTSNGGHKMAESSQCAVIQSFANVRLSDSDSGRSSLASSDNHSIGSDVSPTLSTIVGQNQPSLRLSTQALRSPVVGKESGKISYHCND